MIAPLQRLCEVFQERVGLRSNEEPPPMRQELVPPTYQSPVEEPIDEEEWDEDDIEFTVTPWQRLVEVAGQGMFVSASIVVSVGLHLAALVLLMAITFSTNFPNYVMELTALMNEEQEVIIEPELTLAPVDEQVHDSVMASMAMSMAPEQNDEAELEEDLVLEPLENADILLPEPEHKKLEAFEMNKVVVQEGEAGEEVVYIDGAVDRITAEIMTRLEEGPLLVVWLMDESASLVDDRQQVAERLRRVYREIGDTGSGRSAGLLSAVVGFGQRSEERVGPTADIDSIMEAIEVFEPDQSGVENVFASILYSIDRYQLMRAQQKRQMMVVVWTDESGDDALTRLEQTTKVCQRFQVPVFTVGPSAMFGKQQGLHAYKHPEDGKFYELPVNRGPDTPFRERINLPYWFSGSQFQSMHSGMGPYALTRLAVASGGAYLINDAERDRSPFRFERMRPYLPSYSSPLEYRQEVLNSPLRSAVLQAVEISHQVKIRGTPQLQFAPTGATYIQELIDAQKTAAYNLVQIERMLAPFGSKGMEEAYQEETSARWRAWYDLTYGRLLAMKVRNEEYNWLCAKLKGKGAEFVNERSNRWNFKPADEYLTSSNESMAAEARRLLKRCQEQNMGTPWEYLANRELEEPFGFKVEESYVAPPPPPEPRAANNNNPPPPPPPPPMGRRKEQLRKLEKPKPIVLPKI